MLYHDDDFIMLSALQHIQFCPRQCYLIHAEQQWTENYFTAAGRVMHERVDKQEDEYIRPGVKLVRALPLRSERLGVVGRADLVEFDENTGRVFPVEYKLGKPKTSDCDLIQLCAQAICLEEMLNIQISAGAIYYGKTKHRLQVDISEALKLKTCEVADYAHQILSGNCTPPPMKIQKPCISCSLQDECLPKLGKLLDPKSYLDKELEDDQ